LLEKKGHGVCDAGLLRKGGRKTATSPIRIMGKLGKKQVYEDLDQERGAIAYEENSFCKNQGTARYDL